jgi:hypothetical protein
VRPRHPNWKAPGPEGEGSSSGPGSRRFRSYASPGNSQRVLSLLTRALVTGVFDIHSTPKLETLPVEFSLSGSTLQVAGALTFPWSEFGMRAPSVGGSVSVTGKATMEFDLRLQRA